MALALIWWPCSTLNVTRASPTLRYIQYEALQMPTTVQSCLLYSLLTSWTSRWRVKHSQLLDAYLSWLKFSSSQGSSCQQNKAKQHCQVSENKSHHVSSTVHTTASCFAHCTCHPLCVTGKKVAWRLYDKQGKAVLDYLTRDNEAPQRGVFLLWLWEAWVCAAIRTASALSAPFWSNAESLCHTRSCGSFAQVSLGRWFSKAAAVCLMISSATSKN